MEKAGIMKATDLKGPTISGTVNVPLLELDQMRADHARAVQIANELEERQSLVKVIIMERKHHYEIGRYGNRYIMDDKYEEVGVEYKNLEDFRTIIRLEELEKIQKQMTQLQEQVQKCSDTIVKQSKEGLELNSQLKESKKEAATLKLELEKATPFQEKFYNQVEITKGINSLLAEALKENERLAHKKSFWGFL